VQLYNPVTNTWSLGQPGLYGDLQDSGSATLANGSIVASDLTAAQTQIFSPATNSWTAAGPRPAPAGEDGWVTLPDGSVVAMSAGGQYRYNPGDCDLRCQVWKVIQVSGFRGITSRAAPIGNPRFEQVLGSCLEALGAEQFEAEGVSEAVGRVERGADRQRILGLLA
jgi:hypothetical protein